VPLFAQAVEIDERVMADGTVLAALDEDRARAALQSAFDHGLRSIAIVLMHGWKYPAHEAALARIAAEVGFGQISVSHRVAPLIKLIARGDTTVVDAYLSPVLRRYVAGLEAGLGPAVAALYMQSSGGLAAGEAFHGKDAVLSGPAGGIVGMAATAKAAGFAQVVGFDMGGTSTDVLLRRQLRARGRGAGGGIAHPRPDDAHSYRGGGRRFDLPVRRHAIPGRSGSAGAVPGPACYRRGGPLAVTDCNLLLGKLQPDHFPHVFGPDGNQPLDRDAVERRFAELTAHVHAATGRAVSPEEAAEGFLRIAVANMANAIKAISVRRGHDVTRATLACFGGAGGQHACLVADALGIDTVQCHPLASVLSAYGMGLADRRAVREATLGCLLDAEGADAIAHTVGLLGDAAEAELVAGDGGRATLRREVTLHLRPQGTENTIEVAHAPLEAMQTAFAADWQHRFGFAPEGRSWRKPRVEAVAVSRHADAGGRPARTLGPPAGTVSMFTAGERHATPLYRREDLACGFAADGPALIVDPVSTTVVEPGWRVESTPSATSSCVRHNRAPWTARRIPRSIRCGWRS
jgi:5-oxoprolinase (ATP-hydrolysing)